MLVVNVIVVILLLLTGYSYFVKPEYSIIFPFLCYLFPLVSLVNFFFLFYWLFRFKIGILIPITGILLTFGVHKAWFPVAFKAKNIPEKTLSILTYNIQYLEYPYENEEDNVHPAIRYIQESDADIVCLQEVGDIVLNKIKNKKAYRKALKAYPYIISGSSEGLYSVVCLSKYPYHKSNRIKYESKSNSSFMYEILVGDDTIRIVNNHLESNKLDPVEKKKYSTTLRNRDSGNISELARIIKSKVGSATSIRGQQAMKVHEMIEDSHNKTIVCGDFNDVPGSYTYRKIRNGLADSWIEKGFGWGNTFHDNLFLFRIDYILHSKDLECVECKIDRVRYSDHYPLRAKLVLK
jgi:endonuclease/exonuclease/phosphatase family metal-dependent hydrolase